MKLKSIFIIIIKILFVFNISLSQEAIFPMINLNGGITLLDLKFENINIDTLKLDEQLNHLNEDNYALSFINCKGSMLYSEKIRSKHFYSIKIQSHDNKTITKFIEELANFESIGHIEFNTMNLNQFNLDSINLPNINGIQFSNCNEINSNLNFINQFKDVILEKSYFNFNSNLLTIPTEKDRSALLYIDKLEDLMNMNYFSDLDYLSIIIEKSFKTNLNNSISINKLNKNKINAKRFCIDNKYKEIDSFSLNFILNLVSSENIEVDNIDVKDLDLELLIDYKDIIFHKCNIGNNFDRFLKLKNLEEISISQSKIDTIDTNLVKTSNVKVNLFSQNIIKEENKELFEIIEKELDIHNSKIKEEEYMKSKK